MPPGQEGQQVIVIAPTTATAREWRAGVGYTLHATTSGLMDADSGAFSIM
jgi:hypothetical protein